MKRFGHMLSLLLFLALFPPADCVWALDKKLIRVFVASRPQQLQLAGENFDFATAVFPDHADIVADRRDEERLAAMGFRYSVLPDEYPGLRKPARQGALYYRSYDEMVQTLQACRQNYPAITRLFELGQSVQGRTIYGLKVSDHPDSEEIDEPGVLYVGNIHAREVITPEIIFYFLEHLLNGYGHDDRITRLIQERQLWMIPSLNPDGHVRVEAGDRWWRKNCRINADGSIGVDLNRNFSYRWGYDFIGSSPVPADETYRGPAAFSEPETQIIRDFVRRHRVDASLFYHSYGNLWLFPWSYGYVNTPHHPVFLEMGRAMAQANGYTPGNSSMGVIYLVNGDSDDYLYGDLVEKERIFAFTPEAGTTFYPRPESILRLVDENLPANLYLAEVAGLLKPDPFRVLPPSAPALALSTSDDDGRIHLAWRPRQDSLNNAISFDVQELTDYGTVTDSAETPSPCWMAVDVELSEVRAFSGRKSYYSATVQPIRSELVLRYPLRVQDNARFTFKTWFDLEPNYDYFYVQISLDQGNTYSNLGGNLSRADNPGGRNLGFGITGASNGWQNADFDLSSFKGQDVLLRIRHITEGDVRYGGLYIDQLGPLYLPQTAVAIRESSADTACALEKSAPGLYSYRVRGYDGDGQASVWSRPYSVQVDFGRRADINRDEKLDLLDVQRCAELAVAAGRPATRGELWRANLDSSPEPGAAAVTVLDAVRLTKQITPTAASPSAASGESVMSLGQASGRPGETVRVPVRLVTRQEISGWQIQIVHNALAAVHIDSVQVRQSAQDFITVCRDSQAVQLSTTRQTMPAGEYDLAELYVRIPAAAHAGVDSLHLGARTMLSDQDGMAIDSLRCQSGWVQISRSATDVETASQPTQYHLQQNYPNPFNQQTVLAYTLAQAGTCTLTLFDVQGRELTVIRSGYEEAGPHSFIWNSRERASGVYLLRLQANGFTLWRKMIVLR